MILALDLVHNNDDRKTLLLVRIESDSQSRIRKAF